MTHKDLIEVAYAWLLKNGCGIAFKELVAMTGNGEIPDAIGFCAGESTVIEVKISLADFYKDKKKHFRTTPQLGMGNRRYYMCPVDLIKVEQLPERWGLIYVGDNLKSRTVFDPWRGPYVNQAQKHVSNLRAEAAVMYSALRRLHLSGHFKDIYIPLEKRREEHRAFIKQYFPEDK